MKQRILDQRSNFSVSALGLGCMGMSEWYGPSDRQEAQNTIKAAFELGIDFFDTADMYGKGDNEKLVGEAITSFREKAVIATKCGIVRDATGPDTMGLNGSYEYIISACDASLERLNLDYIDLYYLHRIDPTIPIEESMGALHDLKKSGKIRFIGLSEVDASTLKKAHAICPITAVQTEYSLTARRAAEDILSLCRELQISFVPYSPIGRGLLSNKYQKTEQLALNDWRRELPQFQEENLSVNLNFVQALENLAQKKSCTVTQLSLAWLLAQDKNIIPIPGTRRVKHLQENCGAVDVVLTQDELMEIEHLLINSPIRGHRLPDALMEMFKLNY